MASSQSVIGGLDALVYLLMVTFIVVFILLGSTEILWSFPLSSFVVLRSSIADLLSILFESYYHTTV